MKDIRHATTTHEGEHAAQPTKASTSGRFLRGLTIGAFVGAAIAGSAVWERLRKRDDEASDEPPDHDAAAE